MKKTVIALSLLAAIGVTGCSTTKDAGVRAPVESTLLSRTLVSLLSLPTKV